jgi:predicted TIM-barrel fold metal-dependent hydrolase
MLGVAGSSALLPRGVLGQTKPYRIDVHYHHIAPAWIVEDIVARSLPPLVIKQAREWTPAHALEEMDRNMVEAAVCSVSNPGVWFGDVSQGRRLARACNEYAAQMSRDNPGRFGSFAALPLPDTDGSLDEISHAFDVLKADGVGLFTSYGDKWLADPAFSPVFDELNRRNAVVYVHPIAPACCRSLIPGMPAAVIEYPIDTTRAILQWIMTKSTERYPNIRIIFSHAGGLIVGGVGRLMILIETQPPLREKMPENLRDEIGKLYYEISSSSDPVTMTALRALVPNSRILLGTDSPFGPMSPTIDQLQTLGLSRVDLTAIERDNALALMPQLS